jgi:hypothetical protein
MAGFADKLKRLNKSFKASKAASSVDSASKVPDGTYYAKVARAAIQETKKDPKYLQSKWMFEIVEGDMKGKKLFTTYNIGHPEYGQMNMEFLKRDLEIMGVDNPDLLQAHEEALDSVVELRAHTKAGSRWQNIYLNNLIDAPSQSAESGDDFDEEEEEEELPPRPKKKTKKKKKATKSRKKTTPPPPVDEDDEDDDFEDIDLDFE